MKTQMEKPTTAATYWSQDDLNEITNPRVRVVVSYILDNLTKRGISYRARVRTPARAQVIKIRSIETSSEIVIVVPQSRTDHFEVRFYQHGDRYRTTTPSRLVIRKVDIDTRKITDYDSLGQFIDNDVVAWLVPNRGNLKAPLVPMLVLENVNVCPSSLVAIGFVVEHASVKAGVDGTLTATISNYQRKIVRTERTIPDVVLTNSNESLVGRIYVEFANGDYLFMTEKIFHQQFKFFREGMVDTSVRH